MTFSLAKHRHYVLAAKLSLTALLLVYLASRVDLSKIATTLQSVRADMLVASILQLCLIPLLGSARWRIALSSLGYTIALPRLLKLFWIGMSLNQVLPGAVGGDAVRGWMIYNNGIGAVDAALSVLIERVMLLVLLLLVVAGSSLASDLVPRALALVCAVGGIAALIFTAILPRLEAVLSHFPDVAIIRLARRASHGLTKITSSWSSFSLLAILCVLTHLNLVLASYWLGMAFGLPLSFSTHLVITPLLTLASVIPISVGGWGVREATAVGLLSPHVGQDLALLYSIGFGVILLFASLPGFASLLWHWIEKRMPSDTRQAARQVT